MTDPIQKLYFSIDESARTLGVNKSKIRYYEKEFGLRLTRKGGNRRKLTVKEIGRLAVILRLSEFLTLEACKTVIFRGVEYQVLELLEKPEEKLGGVPMRIYA